MKAEFLNKADRVITGEARKLINDALLVNSILESSPEFNPRANDDHQKRIAELNEIIEFNARMLTNLGNIIGLSYLRERNQHHIFGEFKGREVEAHRTNYFNASSRFSLELNGNAATKREALKFWDEYGQLVVQRYTLASHIERETLKRTA